MFLPGWDDIERLRRRLAKHQAFSKHWILPLHSQIRLEQQKQVERAKRGSKDAL